MTSTSRTSALDRVLELNVLLNSDMTAWMSREGLTPSRAHLLWELHHRGSSTQRVLAEAMGVSARNVTGLVDALVSTSFVTREPHPTDRRAALVSLTRHGSTVVTAMAEGHVELAEVLFGGLSDEAFACFTAALDEVVNRLRARLELEDQGVTDA
jgi:DNA-binding MarR family transcriptional regulator